LPKQFRYVFRRDTTRAKLAGLRTQYFGDSNYTLLNVSYEWLKPWELGGKQLGIWQGPAGKARAKKAIKWLVEEIKDYSLLQLPKIIRRPDFVDNGLGGMLGKLFDSSPRKAIMFAYPKKYKKEDFNWRKKPKGSS